MSKEIYVDYVRSFDQSNLPYHKAKIFEKPQFVEIGRLIKIGRGLFPRILFINDTFYELFSVKGSVYHVRGFDQDWEFTGFEKRLTPEGELDVDQDIAFDGEYIYEYCMRRPSTKPGEPRPQQGPGAQIRKFDAEFNLVNKTPIFKGENETIVDQNIAVINGKIYAGSEYREGGDDFWRRDSPREMQNIPPNPEVARATHLRIYDTDLNLLEERNLIATIEGAIIPHQYWGLGASQLYADGYYCVVTHTPIGNVSYFDRGESIGARQIFILRFDDDFNFVDSKGPLSDTNYDNSWCTGSLYADGRYYISYMCITKGFMTGPGMSMPKDRKDNLRLEIFDEDFKELETINITSSGGTLPSIFKMGNKLYIPYDHPKERGTFVQELILKNFHKDPYPP